MAPERGRRLARGGDAAVRMRRRAVARPALLLALLPLALAADGDWSACAPPCKCKWFSGRKTAECSNGSLSAVPQGLSPEIQTLDLSGNAIAALPADAFRRAHLVNLHKLFVRDCGVAQLHRDAFRGLEILIELDLSRNRIRELAPGTFRDNVRLRVVSANHNPIRRLADHVFVDLPHLQTVELSHCQLTHLGQRPFSAVPNLQTLRLDSNRLTSLRPEPLLPLDRLKSLVLHNNPWRCDCGLAALHAWTRERNLYTPPTACSEPEALRGRLWSDLSPDQLACAPRVVYPSVGARLEAAATGDVTLRCRAEGEPPPAVHWVYNSRVVSNDTRRPGGGSDGRGYTLRAGGGWLNLTVHDLHHADRGEYTCVAKSSGGLDERAVTLVVVAAYAGGALAGISTTLAWILLLGVGSVLILCIIVAIFCWFCRTDVATGDVPTKKNGRENPGGNGKQVAKEAVATTEQEKTLIKKVNPVQKPPRNVEAAAAIVSASSDTSDAKTALLDTSSVKQAPSVAGSECTQVSSTSSGCNSDSTVLQNSANEGVVQTATRKIYPPDLLSFPSRTSQIVPNANIPFRTFKNAQLTSPQNVASSPLTSPLSHQAQHLFDTLPHSLSQSSLSTALLNKANSGAGGQRTGFVTLPRNPHLVHRNSITEGSLASHCLSMKPGDAFSTGSPLVSNAALSLNRNLRSGTMPTIVKCLPLSPTTKRLFLPPHHSSNSPIEELPPSAFYTERKPTLVRRHSTKSNMSSPLLSPDLVQINSFHEGHNQTSPLRINEGLTSPLRINENFVRHAPDGASVRGHEEFVKSPSVLDTLSPSFSRDNGGRSSRKYKLPAAQHFQSNIISADPLSRTLYHYDNEDGTAV
ncbi:uncharacterized protein LOC124622120 isoform X1 [Schistocerca americana]|uniref:uncharacterized protein LOC124622120 isoform X1 n=2 Tax=Schistocerca americana TaxID=7009 RepID=UPI001F5036C7|nr:uncharacterized protein LOC124622120 isoform X1 [Schistocerca americana]